MTSSWRSRCRIRGHTLTLWEPPGSYRTQTAACLACILNMYSMNAKLHRWCVCMCIHVDLIHRYHEAISQSVSLMVSSECSDQPPLIYPCHEPRAHYPTKHERVAVWPLLPPTRITPGKWLYNYPLIVSPLHRSAFSSCRPALIESPWTQCINSNFAIEI